MVMSLRETPCRLTVKMNNYKIGNVYLGATAEIVYLGATAVIFLANLTEPHIEPLLCSFIHCQNSFPVGILHHNQEIFFVWSNHNLVIPASYSKKCKIVSCVQGPAYR